MKTETIHIVLKKNNNKKYALKASAHSFKRLLHGF